jgi:hypothetical protein
MGRSAAGFAAFGVGAAVDVLGGNVGALGGDAAAGAVDAFLDGLAGGAEEFGGEAHTAAVVFPKRMGVGRRVPAGVRC